MCLLILHVLIIFYLYDNNNKKQILNLDIKFYFKNASVCLDTFYIF